MKVLELVTNPRYRPRILGHLCLLIVVSIIVGVGKFGIPASGWLWAIYCGAIFCGYMFLLEDCATNLYTKKKVEEPWLAFVFFALSALLIILLAFPWHAFASVAANGVRQPSLSFVDSLYFSCVVFTTLGFGDLTPANDASKCYVLFQAIFGATHMVASFAIIANRILGNSREPTVDSVIPSHAPGPSKS